MDTFSVAEASLATGISKPSLRKNSQVFAKWLSPLATPPSGEARMFSAEDLRVLRYVADQTGIGLNHVQILEKLEAGELEDYSWSVEDAGVRTESIQSTALMPPDMVRITQALIDEYRQRAETMALREKEMQQRIIELERQLGEATGRLAEVKSLRYRAPAWAKAIFGSRGD